MLVDLKRRSRVILNREKGISMRADWGCPGRYQRPHRSLVVSLVLLAMAMSLVGCSPPAGPAGGEDTAKATVVALERANQTLATAAVASPTAATASPACAAVT